MMYPYLYSLMVQERMEKLRQELELTRQLKPRQVGRTRRFIGRLLIKWGRRVAGVKNADWYVYASPQR